jgi:hypothetical protein
MLASIAVLETIAKTSRFTKDSAAALPPRDSVIIAVLHEQVVSKC